MAMGDLCPDHLRVGDAEEQQQAEHERRAQEQRDERGEEHVDARRHDGQQVAGRPRRAQMRGVGLEERRHLGVSGRHHVGDEEVLEPDPSGGHHGREREPHPRDRDEVVVEQRAGNGDPEHELDDHPRLKRAAERDLESGPGDHHGGEPAPELEPERVNVGCRAADDGVEHHVQEALEILELVARDLGRDVRVDGLLHGGALPGLPLAAHVERRDPHAQPVAERLAILERGGLHRPGKRVRAHPALPPLGEMFEAGEFRLPHAARLLDRLVGHHLAQRRVDPALAQRSRDFGLLKSCIRQVAVFCRLRFRDVR